MFKTIVFSALVAVAASSAIDSCGNVVGPVCGGDLGLIQPSGYVSGCSSGSGQIVANNCQCQKIIQRYRPVQSVQIKPTERRVIQTSSRNVVQRIPYEVNVGPNVGPVYGSSLSSSVLPSSLGYGASVLPYGCGSSPVVSSGASILPIGVGCDAAPVVGCDAPIQPYNLGYADSIIGASNLGLPSCGISSPVYGSCGSVC